MTTAQTTEVRQKYSSEKTTVGGITCLTMHGTLNEGFEGRKTAMSVRTKKVVVHMAEVHRFASWGMSEWMDFLRVTTDCDVYIVECNAYAVSQLNLVTGLLGHAKLVSFYASYRCTGCNEELQTVFLTPRDAIRDIPGSYRQCPSCGGRARLEEYPAAFFDTIASRPAFDIDDEVLAFMRQHLNYDLSPDLTRFRAYRRRHKDYTYLRLTGNIGTLPADVLANATPNSTVVVDVEGVVFDPMQLENWRTYLRTALPKVKAVQLLGCPPGFIEAGVPLDDLRSNLKVRTFQETYRCGTCDATSNHTIDVAMNLEELVQGLMPQAHCPACRSSMQVEATPEAATVLRALPARDRDVALDAFLQKSKQEPPDKLENALSVGRAEPAGAKPSGTSRRVVYAGIGVLAAAAGVLAFLKLSNRSSEAGPRDPQLGVNPGPPPRTFTRPDWIISDVPSSAYCHDMINRLMCVGVSSYRPNKEAGAAEAQDAALEELASTVGLKISDPFFRDTVMPAYSSARSKALSALQLATQERSGDPKTIEAYNAAAEPVRASRHSVVEALQATAGAAVPAQRSDWYWEEYARETGEGTEFLVFVRYDVSLDAVRTLVDKYSATTQVLGSSAMTAFPCLGWKLDKFRGGAYLTKVGHPLSNAGVASQQLVVAVGDKKVIDAPSLAHDLEESSHGEVKLTVAAAGVPDRVVSVKR